MSVLLGRELLCRSCKGSLILGPYVHKGLGSANLTSQLIRSSSLFTNTPKSLLLSNEKASQLNLQLKRSSSHGDHVKLWTAEKALSASLLPIFPLAFMFPSTALDSLLALAITLHSHWGIEAIVVDYVRPSVFGETIPKISIAMVYGLSALTLGGLLYFSYTDIGIANAIKMFWKL